MKLSAADLARLLDVSVDRIEKYLVNLAANGYVERDGDGITEKGQEFFK